MDVTPELLSVTPAKKRKAPVALADGINDIMFEVKSVPFANRTNDIPDAKVSLISSTIISTLLEFVSFTSNVTESPGEYFADPHVLVTEILFAVIGTITFFPCCLDCIRDNSFDIASTTALFSANEWGNEDSVI